MHHLKRHSKRTIAIGLLALLPILSGCFRYSFTGTSIPEDVNTIFIPFFPDQSSSGLGTLSDQLNRKLIDRFVNQSRLQLANSAANADANLEGQIVGYSDQPFTVGGDQATEENRVTITVQATFQYAKDDQPLWSKRFEGYGNYDPNENPIDGEQAAADEALDMIARNMFNDSMGQW
jgi:outer membrane lipopolysaccharide assembly protein LptE/RlpB